MIRRLLALLLVAGTMSGCKAWSRRNLTVELVDVDGLPITNATVTVLSSKGRHGGWCREDEYYHISATSDSNGVASINFWSCSPCFHWRAKSPSHYDRRLHDKQFERFDEDDLKREREGKTPRSIPCIHRMLVLYPKRNPQKMISNRNWDRFSTKKTIIQTNGYDMVVYRPEFVDLERGYVSTVIKNSMCRHADFTIERYCVETNGVKNTYGRIVFDQGGGAYRCKQTGDSAFPAAYLADTNAVYETSFGFHTIVDSATGKILSKKRVIGKDEYLVVRTRKSTVNGVAGWHYSELIGPMDIDSSMRIETSAFNPRFNDTNIEYDPSIR